MQEQVVMITGAARGIGYEIARAFGEEGATVILTDIDEKGLADASAQLTQEGIDSHSQICDVTSEDHIKRTLNHILDNHGRIDVLINNAGLQHVASIEEFPTEKFEQLVQLMLVAPFMTTKHVFPIMKHQQFGRIINMASINGVIGFSGKAAYNSAKHGVIGLTKVAALEGAEHGITVNALCPGYVDTALVRNQMNDLAKNRNVPLDEVLKEVIYPLVPQKRLLAVKEVADYAMFLASDKAKAITGQATVIDGGYTAQ
ncbi:3-hydroxybutyrate dehydrogenase [Tuberibacillus sp. Marseille-P3662]|uniref:3-hydroxybutyrate dehydrogenase n=1 Tax=Tuberibacillus sp. Marseille-P3662 TaxID=1965358 RepID=UPI000A1C859C|nr:3-hydroxybutyrate dehydrogenase [Tuberibacillus sp. Marseille-P3662]